MDPTHDPALALDDDELAHISRPLRETPIILIMSANPKDDLRLDEEMREIRSELEKTEFGRQFQLELRPATVYKDLQRYVAETTPTILHFSGHGDVPGIMLEDERGKPYLVPGTALATLLSLPFIKDQLRLVVLNACLSETQARMIAQEIDVVVGMASNIGDEAAINFARGLYSGLGMGRDVASAFALGRNAIEIANLPEELTPQIFVREGAEASRIMPLAGSPAQHPIADERQSQPRETAREKLVRRFGVVRATILALGALASAVTAILAVVFLIWPALRPDPEANGEILELRRVWQNISQGEYCDRVALAPIQVENCANDSAAMRARRGDAYEVKVAAVGYNGTPLTLNWSIMPESTASSGSTLDESAWDQPTWPDSGFTPSRDDESQVLRFWIPYPEDKNRQYIRLTLQAADGTLLATKDTEPFESQ
jgi:hypothetical protein